MPSILHAVCVAVTAAALVAGGAAVAAPPTPQQVVESFHFGLIAAMKNGGTCAARAKPLGGIIQADFDFPGIARQVLRRHWDKLDGTQRQRFTETLTRLVINTYAREFEAYGGETFETVSSADYGSGLKQVRTRMKRQSGEPVAFDYLLRDTGAGWRIVNIVADGVSDLAVRSSQYDAIMKSEGLDALLDKLAKQADGC
ncbi:MAG TPA: ABC transporter substrate-binding protein [Nevskiaceae bacterium]|nr:ABC transporter substrate-binding protein [Nevskiaceae bacterium]